MPIRRPVS